MKTIVIIGRNDAGKVVAEDRTDAPGKASQIANCWRGAGLVIEFFEYGDTPPAAE